METQSILGSLAALAPVAIQWLRAKKSVPEWATVLLVALSGVVTYWLFAEGDPMTREFWRGAAGWVIGAFGANQLTSSAANMGLAVVPRTNSQP